MTERPGVERIARAIDTIPVGDYPWHPERPHHPEYAAALYDAGLRVVDSPEPEKAREAIEEIGLALTAIKSSWSVQALVRALRAATPAPPEAGSLEYAGKVAAETWQRAGEILAAPSGPALDVEPWVHLTDPTAGPCPKCGHSSSGITVAGEARSHTCCGHPDCMREGSAET